MFYARWTRRDVRPRDAGGVVVVDASTVVEPGGEPLRVGGDGSRFRPSFSYKDSATTFAVGDCVIVCLEGPAGADGEATNHAAAQILQIWWPPGDGDGPDEPWVEVRWFYCAEEIKPAKHRPAAARAHPLREVFETDHVDEVPASSLMGKVAVLDADAFAALPRATADDKLAARDAFFCRYVWRLASRTLVRVGPASERMSRALACARRAKGANQRPATVFARAFDREDTRCSVGTKRSAAAWDGDVVSESSDDEGDGRWSARPPRDEGDDVTKRLRRAAAALQLSAAPTPLPCREAERGAVADFLEEALAASRGDGRTLYVSGMPGTGKTATVREVVGDLRKSRDFDFVEINAMRLPQPAHAYAVLWEALGGEKRGAEAAARCLEKLFGAKGGRDGARPAVLLVDELDYMVTQRQDVLYNLFDWPSRAGANLCVVGIANTMDLPERLDPKVRSRLGGRRLTFPPYGREQVEAIVHQRLDRDDLRGAFSGQAVTMAARKVAAYSGDVRRALQICAKATDVCADRRRAGGDGGDEVSIADVNAAHRALTASAYLAAVEHAAPLERLVLVALCVELKARRAEVAGFDDVARRAKRLVALASDDDGARRAPTHAELLDIVDRFADARLLAPEYNGRNDRFPSLRLNCAENLVAGVLVNAGDPVAVRFLGDT